MVENKTKPTAITVRSFLNKIKEPQVRRDCDVIIEIMESISKLKPVMWGSAIIGFGTRHYVYESGREGDTMIVGFSPRKQAIALYLAGGLESLRAELSKLGKHSTGKESGELFGSDRLEARSDRPVEAPNKGEIHRANHDPRRPETWVS